MSCRPGQNNPAADLLLPDQLHFRVDALSEIVILRAILDDERDLDASVD